MPFSSFLWILHVETITTVRGHARGISHKEIPLSRDVGSETTKPRGSNLRYMVLLITNKLKGGINSLSLILKKKKSPVIPSSWEPICFYIIYNKLKNFQYRIPCKLQGKM